MISKSKTQTQKFAIRLANKILKTNRFDRSVGATVIALHGDLGAGKTTFVQGFIKALSAKHHVTSPTFVIYRKYPIHSQFIIHNSLFKSIYHFDLYRIHRPKEILAFGFKKIISDPENIVLIEWPERIKKLLPKNTAWIVIEHGKKENERIIDLLDQNCYS